MLGSSDVKEIFTVRVKQLMSREERNRLMEAVENEIAKSGQIRILVELDEPRANDPGALLDDLNWMKIHSENIERAAIVGDRTWEETWIAIARLFGAIQMKYFDRQLMEEAHRWLSG
ncbi:MAG: STAS/SEC14 domain-containing protein [Desulforhabdus sp.]|nr:STAS/SEC14 domain-containing protein [Desulforhabdus sp.]